RSNARRTHAVSSTNGLDTSGFASRWMLSVGNKMHKAFPLPGESSHWRYKFPLLVEGVPTAGRMKIPLPGVCTAMMKKLTVKDRWQLHKEDGIRLAHDSSSNCNV
nr:hypothetical protein [Tanacetum cinerariifolium]